MKKYYRTQLKSYTIARHSSFAENIHNDHSRIYFTSPLEEESHFISINANKTGRGAPKEQNKNENLFDNDMLSERNKPGELSVSM